MIHKIDKLDSPLVVLKSEPFLVFARPSKSLDNRKRKRTPESQIDTLEPAKKKRKLNYPSPNLSCVNSPNIQQLQQDGVDDYLDALNTLLCMRSKIKNKNIRGKALSDIKGLGKEKKEEIALAAAPLVSFPSPSFEEPTPKIFNFPSSKEDNYYDKTNNFFSEDVLDIGDGLNLWDYENDALFRDDLFDENFIEFQAA